MRILERYEFATKQVVELTAKIASGNYLKTDWLSRRRAGYKAIATRCKKLLNTLNNTL